MTTGNGRQARHLPAGPTPDEVRERIAPSIDPGNPYIHIKLQDGPIGEVGVNGAQIDDVLTFCANVLGAFYGALPDRATSLALWHVNQALVQLAARRREREVRGVEGTGRP
jgi:hypothetical protein